MEIFRDADAPALDPGVERRLAVLDPNLHVVWSRWELDPLTGQPIIDRWGERIRVRDPQGNPSAVWHLWSRTGERWYYVRQYFDFGHQQVARLEADLARFERPEDILTLLRERAEKRQAARDAAREQQREDMHKANKKRIGDLIFEGKSGMRTRNPVSYPGQENRSTPTERFLVDAKEDGWELPEGPPEAT